MFVARKHILLKTRLLTSDGLGKRANMGNGSSKTIPNMFKRIEIQRSLKPIHLANICFFKKIINNVISVGFRINAHKKLTRPKIHGITLHKLPVFNPIGLCVDSKHIGDIQWYTSAQ
ncbi:hypothetical protein TNCV_2638641 [Trichonephila clavipes]|nr:hypothetical protein TNCV_2638641 [Trichonephila clavipes]